MIFVDADACPVKSEIVRVAERNKARVLMVCNGGLRPYVEPFVDIQVVPDGPDEADKWIAERAGAGDICVTGDLPLAERCVHQGAFVLTHSGEEITPQNVGPKIATRDLMADLRAADPFMQGRGRPFDKSDRARFLNALDKLVVKARKPGP